MSTYASTFIVGFAPFIEAHLNKLFPDVTILKTLDGLIVYKTSASWETLKKLDFLSNTYYVIADTNNVNLGVVNKLRNQKQTLQNLPKNNKTFRIVVSKENEMQAISEQLRRNLEESLTKLTHLRVNRNLPDIEFWFLFRTEGYGFFGIRLTKHPDYKKILPAGELRPELANLLCLLAEPSNDDTFLDPFAGYGAIPFQRAKIRPYKKILASDINHERLHFLKTKLKALKNISILKEDALNLKSITDSSVDNVATDPPWGYYENTDTDFNVFYEQMLQELGRVLKSKGIAVILTAKKEEFLASLSKVFAFDLQVKYDILVSGKKAGVYKLVKK